MRVLLASEYFYPQTRGGTEMYVYQLAKELINNGHECAILSISNSQKFSQYEGIDIFYIPFIDNIAQESSNPKNFGELTQIISSYKPDIFHLHTYTPSLGINHLEKLNSLGIKTVFTTHLSSLTCIRGDLMLNGEEFCDGKLDRKRCLNCYFQFKGFDNPLIKKSLLYLSESNLIKSLYSTLKIYDNKWEAVQIFKEKVDHVVAVSEWQKKILKLNGFDESKISVVRQAVDQKVLVNERVNKKFAKIRIGFIGRIVPVKGLHILLDSIERIDNFNIQLNVAALKSLEFQDYYQDVKERTLSLNGVWRENLNKEDIMSFIDELDILVVPSFWAETGPYVIFEAMARKVPVLSFNKGGAVELVTNNVDGILVDTAEQFNEVIENLNKNTDLINKLSKNIKMNRTTTDLYNEMISVYKLIV